MSAPVLAAPRETFPAACPASPSSPSAPGLWRVARPGGPVLGHIELRTRDDVERYAARRLVAGGIRSIDPRRVLVASGCRGVLPLRATAVIRARRRASVAAGARHG